MTLPLRIVIVSVLTLFAGLTGAQAKGASGNSRQNIEVAAGQVLRDSLPQNPIAFPGGVKAWSDVVYRNEPNYRPLTLDLYVPAGKTARPLVVFIHGGGWFAGNTRQSSALVNFPRVLALLASEGFTVASIEYRLSGEARFPVNLRDVNAAIRFLRAHAAEYRIDTSRVALWGPSAGGHLALLAALSRRDTTLDPDAANDTCVQAAVSWFGVTDLATIPRIAEQGSPEQRMLGCDGGPCEVSLVRAASPLAHVDASDPPVLLIHGEADKTVPAAQSHALEAAMLKAGVNVRSHYYPGIDHSFIGNSPEATRAASLQAIETTFDFFHEKLGVSRK